jgi:two-component system LytT family response regulator
MPNGRPPWRVLIADDEPAARRGVRQLLAAHSGFEVVGECRDGKDVLAALERGSADVLFLDIQMPEVDGFEVVRRRTPERMPAVVFLTAYDQFAIRAFEAQALDYLVKPVTEARFAATIRRLARQLATAAAGSSRGPATLPVSAGRGTMMVGVREIEWIEAADNYVRVWAAGKSYLLRRPIRELERSLRIHGFVRVHRRALLRLDAIRRLVPGGDGGLVVILGSGAEIRVSRRRRAMIAAAVRGREKEK